MEKFPFPPTDNLYKFMAVLGVLTIVAGGWLLYFAYDKANTDFAELYETNRLREREYVGELVKTSELIFDEYLQPIDQIGRYAEEALAKIEKINENDELAVKDIHRTIKDVKDRLSLRQKWLEIQEAFLKRLVADAEQHIAYFKSEAKSISELRHNTVRAAYLLVGLGIVLSFLGFVFWWRHFQRYQDMILRAQAGKP